MQQIIYIDVDEEITSVLDRIRNERVVDIYLSIPKGAILANSILSLKLLKREAEKMGKNIVVVDSNDQRLKNIVERAGIRTGYSQEFNNHFLNNGDYHSKMGDVDVVSVAEKKDEVHDDRPQVSNFEIGSDSFYDHDVNEDSKTQSKFVGGVGGPKDDIANVNPNSNYSNDFNGSVHRVDGSGSFDSKVNNHQDSFRTDKYFLGDSGGHSSESGGDLREGFFLRHKKLFLFVVVLFIFLVAGVGWFSVNYPRLEVTVHPSSMVVEKEVKFITQDDAKKIDKKEGVIPGEYLEISLKKSLTFKSTGEKINTKKKGRATGKVVIYNYYSEKPQVLVKTTRVLSKKSKKLFRLSRTITVPGKSGDEPGKIEVEVYADKTGEDFNIDADEFTIEGFKSIPEKYSAFKVKSEGKMNGGYSLKQGNKIQHVVTHDDLEVARQKTMEALDSSLEDEIQKRLSSNQVFVKDALVKEVVSSKSSYPEGAMTDSFDYTVVYSLKVLVFDANDAENLITVKVRGKLDSGFSVDKFSSIDYKRGVFDVDKRSLVVYAEVKGTAWHDIDVEKLKDVIMAGTMDEIKNVLSKNNGISLAEVRPIPSWFSKIPSDRDKIIIQVKKEGNR